jgi:hypothetical protein
MTVYLKSLYFRIKVMMQRVKSVIGVAGKGECSAFSLVFWKVLGKSSETLKIG